MSGDDAWVLRHTLTNEPRLMLLGTATSRFKEVEDYRQALYDLFRIIELDPLEDGESQALWQSITGVPPSLEQMRPIQILTGGNPQMDFLTTRPSRAESGYIRYIKAPFGDLDVLRQSFAWPPALRIDQPSRNSDTFLAARRQHTELPHEPSTGKRRCRCGIHR